jgi:hypothetical protein
MPRKATNSAIVAGEVAARVCGASLRAVQAWTRPGGLPGRLGGGLYDLAALVPALLARAARPATKGREALERLRGENLRLKNSLLEIEEARQRGELLPAAEASEYLGAVSQQLRSTYHALEINFGPDAVAVVGAAVREAERVWCLKFGGTPDETGTPDPKNVPSDAPPGAAASDGPGPGAPAPAGAEASPPTRTDGESLFEAAWKKDGAPAVDPAAADGSKPA